jgi:hypothetical protein
MDGFWEAFRLTGMPSLPGAVVAFRAAHKESGVAAMLYRRYHGQILA